MEKFPLRQQAFLPSDVALCLVKCLLALINSRRLKAKTHLVLMNTHMPALPPILVPEYPKTLPLLPFICSQVCFCSYSNILSILVGVFSEPD